MTPKVTLPQSRMAVGDSDVAAKSAAPRFLPYGRQSINELDIRAVSGVLTSDWLTQGPTIPAFEKALAEAVGADYAVACANGTAALHLSMLALGVGPGDKVVTTPITFMADANCARYVGADVVFADIDQDTACMSPDALEQVLRADQDKKIKAVIPVHFAGQPADLSRIHELSKAHGAAVVGDACHAIGGAYTEGAKRYRLGGSPHADMTVFSFHPVKHVAAGEGGAIVTDRTDLAEALQRFRNHGIERTEFINKDMGYTESGEPNPWYHELQVLGFNYRLSDIHAALGLSQLGRLRGSIERRRQIAAIYRTLLAETFADQSVRPLVDREGYTNVYHLFVVLIDFAKFGIGRAEVMNRLKERNIGTQVHYIPIHLQPYYRSLYGTGPGDFPNAENYYGQALSLPMYPDLEDGEIVRVVENLHSILTRRS